MLISGLKGLTLKWSGSNFNFSTHDLFLFDRIQMMMEVRMMGKLLEINHVTNSIKNYIIG